MRWLPLLLAVACSTSVKTQHQADVAASEKTTAHVEAEARQERHETREVSRGPRTRERTKSWDKPVLLPDGRLAAEHHEEKVIDHFGAELERENVDDRRQANDRFDAEAEGLIDAHEKGQAEFELRVGPSAGEWVAIGVAAIAALALLWRFRGFFKRFFIPPLP